MKEGDIEQKGNATFDMVKLVGNLLRQHSPINLFEFVVHPESFGQTIENIFYLSFVIRNAMARIEEDENGLPVVTWVPEVPEDEMTGENKQTVLEMTWKHWQVWSLHASVDSRIWLKHLILQNRLSRIERKKIIRWLRRDGTRHVSFYS